MRLNHRFTAALAAAALVTGAGLVSAAPATAEASNVTVDASSAAPAAFDSVSITGLKKKQKQKGKTRSVGFTLNIAGPATSGYDLRYTVGTPEVVRLKSRTKAGVDPYVSRNYEGLVGANQASLNIMSTSAPGLYEVRIPVTQYDRTSGTAVETTLVATARFQLHATKKNSKSRTSFSSPSWIPGKTAAKFTFNAPSYLKGAKVSLFYKKNGAKKYSKIKTAKLKAKGTSTLGTAKINTKKLTKSGKIYFKVKGVKWAPGYKTKAVKVRITRF